MEQPASYYDEVYWQPGRYHAPFYGSQDFLMWARVIELLPKEPPANILELGCGTGQFLQFLRACGVDHDHYAGVDFSEVAIKIARQKHPGFDFTPRDIYGLNLNQGVHYYYDTVIACEFFEHVRGDLEILQQITSGATVLFTVPTNNDQAHVRTFASTEAVIERYGSELYDLTVEQHRSWWIGRGWKR